MASTATVGRDRELKWLPLDKIIPNERNPRGRAHFKPEELRDLERSVAAHGIIEPLIVQPYGDRRQGRFLLIEGERRYTVAQRLGLKEVPTTIVKKLESDDQVVLMYNLHENRKGWEMASHLKAIQELMDSSPDKPEEELAKELGLSLATFRDRLQVLGLGAAVVDEIAKGGLDYTSALRSAQAANTITKKRPELAEKLGGTEKIASALLDKAKARGGLSLELMAGKKDLADTKHVPDDAVERYISETKLGLREVVREQAPPAAVQKRAVEGLSKTIMRIEEDLQEFKSLDLTQAPNLVSLRAALRALIEVAQTLESSIADAIIAAQVGAQDAAEKPKAPRRKGRGPGSKAAREKTVQEAMQAEADQATFAEALRIAQETVDAADDLGTATREGNGRSKTTPIRAPQRKPRKKAAAKK
jgi:ParB/RepB/Spo0J family partition protein